MFFGLNICIRLFINRVPLSQLLVLYIVYQQTLVIDLIFENKRKSFIVIRSPPTIPHTASDNLHASARMSVGSSWIPKVKILFAYISAGYRSGCLPSCHTISSFLYHWVRESCFWRVFWPLYFFSWQSVLGYTAPQGEPFHDFARKCYVRVW